MLYFETDKLLENQSVCMRCNLKINNPNIDVCQNCKYKKDFKVSICLNNGDCERNNLGLVKKGLSNE